MDDKSQRRGEPVNVIPQDPVVQANIDLLKSRSKAGLQKYGVNLSRGDLTQDEWLQHLLEELLDAANYVQAIKHNKGGRNA